MPSVTFFAVMERNEVNGERVDPSRWIQSSACPERDFLLGNSQTLRGRMYAFCPHDDEGYSVSLAEIEEMSPDTSQWIDGYLAGSEPSGEDIYGTDFSDWPDDDPRVNDWREAAMTYRRTGVWPH